jgi:glycosyltransferase involved in cell wall biosynthesis
MYPPQHLGGYELVWQGAVRHLRGLGHDVRVLTTDVRFGDAPEQDAGVFRELRWYWRDHAWPRLGPRARLAIERHNARVFDRHLAEHAPDAVTWWSMGGMSLSLIARARRAGLPSAGFVHDDWLVYGPRADAWLRAMRRSRLLARAAWHATGVPTWFAPHEVDRWMFVSDATRRAAERAVGPLHGAGIAHSGIHPDFLDARPEREWRWRLLYVGRIDGRKGIDTVVDALGHLPAEATLTVVGGGDNEHLGALRARAGERVTFAGARDRAGLKEAYDGADVVVFPVLWEEPWGLVPLEAMGMGRPVVATGRGGSGEYLRDGENALLYPAGDAPALAAAVRALAGDPALRETLRAGGLATAPRHTEAVFHSAVAATVEALGSR